MSVHHPTSAAIQERTYEGCGDAEERRRKGKEEKQQQQQGEQPLWPEYLGSSLHLYLLVPEKGYIQPLIR